LKKPFRLLLPLKSETKFSTYLKTILFISTIAVSNWFLKDLLGYQAVGFIFLLAVMALGLVTALGPTLLGAALSALTCTFFFFPPLFPFFIHQPADIMLFLTYFVVAIMTGIFTFRLKWQQRALRQREEKTNILYEILKAMTLARGVDAVVQVALARLKELFDGEVCVLTAGALEKREPPAFGKMVIDEKERAVALWSF